MKDKINITNKNNHYKNKIRRMLLWWVHYVWRQLEGKNK
jgi:hypothetical protein